MSKFPRRHPELLALEGWHDTGTIRFKFSCRFKDILRCSEFNDKTEHFRSCFCEGGAHGGERYLRCMNSNWAIVFTPDKHGNFLGRAFVHLEERDDESWYLVVDKIYGNKINYELIKDYIMKKNIRLNVVFSQHDTYLWRELP